MSYPRSILFSRIRSLVLPVAAVGLWAAGSLAWSGDAVTMTVSPTTCAVGDTVTVTMNLSGTTNFTAANTPLYFDASRFELLGPSMAASILKGAMLLDDPNDNKSLSRGSDDIPTINASGRIHAGVSESSAPFDQYVGTPAASLVVFKLKAKAAGSASVAIPAYSDANKFGMQLVNAAKVAFNPTVPAQSLVTITGPAAPEMAVARSGALADGGSDAVAGSVAGTATTLTYVISNTGGAALNLTGSPRFAVGGLSNCTVNVTTQPAASIAAAGTSNLVVSVTPTAAGNWSFTLSGDNNDADENPYNWTVNGTATAAPPALPEMGVANGATAVADNGSNAVTGTVAGTARVITYTISNTGAGALNFSGTPPFTLAGQTNCTATVTTQPTASIAAGASSTLVISVTPTAAGAWSFTLSAANNDANENPYNWTVTGTATSSPTPEMDVARSGNAVADASTDSVASSKAGTATSLSYTITNSGAAALTLSGTPPFTLAGQTNCTATVTTQPTASIAAGASSTLVISVTPTAAGAWSFTLSAANNDANESPYNWTVSGTANPAISQLASFEFVIGGPVPTGAKAVNINDGSGVRAATIVSTNWTATVPSTATQVTVTFVANDNSTKSRTYDLVAP